MLQQRQQQSIQLFHFLILTRQTDSYTIVSREDNLCTQDSERMGKRGERKCNGSCVSKERNTGDDMSVLAKGRKNAFAPASRQKKD